MTETPPPSPPSLENVLTPSTSTLASPEAANSSAMDATRVAAQALGACATMRDSAEPSLGASRLEEGSGPRPSLIASVPFDDVLATSQPRSTSQPPALTMVSSMHGDQAPAHSSWEGREELIVGDSRKRSRSPSLNPYDHSDEDAAAVVAVAPCHAHGQIAPAPASTSCSRSRSTSPSPAPAPEQARAVSPDEDDELASAGVGDEELRPPPPKKLRKGARLGRLEPVLDKIPVELLADVLAYLPPVMLLRLARTAKVFRGLLMNKQQSRTIWRRAFQRDGLGTFAVEDVPEPRIAALIWDKECLECGRLKVHKIVYIFEGRYCDPCLKQKVRTRAQIQTSHTTLHPNAFDCAPFSTAPPCRGGNWPALPGQYMAGEYWLEETVVKRSHELKTLTEQDAEDPSGERVTKYVAHWKARIPKIEEDAKMLQKWQAELDQRRSSDKRTLRSERTTIVRQRCLDAGCDARDIEVALRPDSAVYPLINQPYPLTDRVWRKIESPLLSHISTVREQRLAEEARHLALDRAREEDNRAHKIAAERQHQDFQELIGRERVAQAAAAAALAAHQRNPAGVLTRQPIAGPGGATSQAQAIQNLTATSGGGHGAMSHPPQQMSQQVPRLGPAGGVPSPSTSVWNPLLIPQQYQAHAQYLMALRHGPGYANLQRMQTGLPALSFPPRPPQQRAPPQPPQPPQPPTASSIFMSSATRHLPPTLPRMSPSGQPIADPSMGAWWVRSAASAPPGQPGVPAPAMSRPPPPSSSHGSR